MKIVSSDQFLHDAQLAVFNMANEGLDPTDNTVFCIGDVYFVTFSFVLGCQKAMLSTNLPDGKYYEVTYNPDKGEMYVDCYVRIKQNVIK